MIIYCNKPFSGARCSKCNENYFGNPEMPGGSCVKCNCSENWNPEEQGNCDPSSGKCLKCVFDTEGDHCEYCKPGYHGDAVGNGCTVCKCNILGTENPLEDSRIDDREHNCDRFSGECRCLPNVEGDNCDK